MSKYDNEILCCILRYMRRKSLFNGVCTALVTPFRWGEIDWRAFGRLIENQIKAGVGALLVLGTTGEGSTISESEREAIVKFAVEMVSGRVPLIVGIGGNNPATIVRYGYSAKIAGADAVMITSPYYNKATQDGMVRHFTEIAKTLRMPIVVYNIPGRAGINIEPATLGRIAQIRWVVGIKESCGSIAQIQEVIRQIADTKVPVYCGDDTLALPCYSVGCAGVVSVAANAKPREVIHIWRLFKQRKIKSARDAYLKNLPFFNALFCEVNPIPIKWLLSKQGVCTAEVRLPLTELSDKYKTLVEEA